MNREQFRNLRQGDLVRNDKLDVYMVAHSGIDQVILIRQEIASDPAEWELVATANYNRETDDGESLPDGSEYDAWDLPRE